MPQTLTRAIAHLAPRTPSTSTHAESISRGTSQAGSPDQLPVVIPSLQRSDLDNASILAAASAAESQGSDIGLYSGVGVGSSGALTPDESSSPSPASSVEVQGGDDSRELAALHARLRAVHDSLVAARKSAPFSAASSWSMTRAVAFAEAAESTLWTSICALSAELGARR